jgi:serine/threonine-protein kinase
MPSQFGPGLPPALDAWWTKAAARNPDQRFQSASELVEALGDALGLANAPRVSTPSLDLAFAATSSPMSAPTTTPQGPLAAPSTSQGAIARTPYPAPGPTITDPRFATNPTQVTPPPPPHVTMSTASRTFHGGEPKRRGSAAPFVALAFVALGAMGAGAYLFLRHTPSDATADTAAPTSIPLPSSTTVAAAPTLAPDPTDKPVVAPAATTLASSSPHAPPIHTVVHPSPNPPPTPRPARTGKVHIGG